MTYHPVIPSLRYPLRGQTKRFAMNDFTRIVLAFGRGIVKILISALVGFGVGLLVIGIATAGRPDMFRGPPPGEMLMGIGAGLLAGGGTLLALFFLPWFMKRSVEPSFLDEAPPLALPAPRPTRYDSDAPRRRDAPKLPPAVDDSAAPIVRPAPPPLRRDEPGSADFYEK